jgi:5,10-methylenetetrahydrofolate reductase
MKKETIELSEKVAAGAQKAIDQLLARARQLDEYVVIADEHGQPKRIRARDLPERE